MLEEIKNKVFDLLREDNSGHGLDHINQVYTLAMEFVKTEEQADKDIVAIIALLHDVDDYKLFGEESAINLTNARRIMQEVNISFQIQEQVLDELKCLGYSKRLKGIKPKTIEGKIVSDADMCDALGAKGIIRAHSYGIKINRPFFNSNIFPTDELDTKYHLKGNTSTINFIIATLLEYKNNMLTDVGIKEALKRHNTIVDFLYNYFEEENVPKWTQYLNTYLK